MPVNVMAVGELARQALARSGGDALPLSGFTHAPYYEAAGEIVWVGAKLPALHPRAVVTSAAPHPGAAMRVQSMPERSWSAKLPLLEEAAAKRVRAAVRRLLPGITETTTPHGFGTVLAGGEPAFPFDACITCVRGLIAAYALDDADGAVSASRGLLGVGNGLTPSGDDLVGAALFGHRLVSARSSDWDAAAADLTLQVKDSSNAVSAALFDDLACGRSFAPLHALAEALTRDDDTGALRAARELSVIGHSSGWDMLTGFIIGTNASACSWSN